MWAVQAGTAVSKRVRREADNSVNVVRYHARNGSPRRARIERWDYRQAADTFELASAHDLELALP
jgi:hypothetical protein